MNGVDTSGRTRPAVQVTNGRIWRVGLGLALFVGVASNAVAQLAPAGLQQQRGNDVRVADSQDLRPPRVLAGTTGGELKQLSNPTVTIILGELSTRFRVEPRDGTYRHPNPGDEALVAVPLRDLDHPDRSLYIYIWPLNGQYLLLQVDGNDPFRELHLWSGAADEIVVSQSGGVRTTKLASSDTFRISPRLSVAAVPSSLSVLDVIGCLGRLLGSLDQDLLSNQLSQVGCGTLTTLAFILTANACLTAAASVLLNPLADFSCVVGMAKLVTCGIASCGTACTGAPSAPVNASASASGSSVTLSWGGSSGTPTTYVTQSGSTVTGSMTLTQNSITSSGTFTGTLTPNSSTSASLAWTIRYSYLFAGLPCQGSFGGPATATATAIQGTYSGSDCHHVFSNGTLSVRKQ
jgi:hypothetical protein